MTLHSKVNYSSEFSSMFSLGRKEQRGEPTRKGNFINKTLIVKKTNDRTSLVTQCLRICLPMLGTRVRSLVWEDPTCRGATQARAPQLLSLRSRARERQLLSPCVTTTEAACLEPVLHNKRSHRNEKPAHHNEE